MATNQVLFRETVSYYQMPLQTPGPPGGGFWTDGRSRCHHCLEPLPQTGPGTHPPGICPICCRSILTSYQNIPLHLFDRTQQWSYLMNEVEYIWGWKYDFFQGYKSQNEGYWGQEYYGMNDGLTSFAQTQHHLREKRIHFLSLPDPLEDLFFQAAGKDLDPRDLADHLAQGRPWRQRARELSLSGATPKQVLELQIGMLGYTDWAVYGSTPRTKETLRILKARLEGE